MLQPLTAATDGFGDAHLRLRDGARRHAPNALIAVSASVGDDEELPGGFHTVAVVVSFV